MTERTMLAFALADAQVPGRFGQVETVVVVGATPAPSYSAGGQRDVVGQEPPLSPYDNPAFDELEPSAVSSPAEATGDAARAPSSSPFQAKDVECTASSLSR